MQIDLTVNDMLKYMSKNEKLARLKQLEEKGGNDENDERELRALRRYAEAINKYEEVVDAREVAARFTEGVKQIEFRGKAKDGHWVYLRYWSMLRRLGIPERRVIRFFERSDEYDWAFKPYRLLLLLPEEYTRFRAELKRLGREDEEDERCGQYAVNDRKDREWREKNPQPKFDLCSALRSHRRRR